jgi:hypothetical protein
MSKYSYVNHSVAGIDLETLMRVRSLFPPDTLGGMAEIFQMREALTALAVLALSEFSEADKQSAQAKLREMLALNVRISAIQAEGEAFKREQGLI